MLDSKNGHFFLILTFFLAGAGNAAFADVIRIDHLASEAYREIAPVVAFFNHPNNYFDSVGAARPAIVELDRMFRSRHFKTYMTVDRPATESADYAAMFFLDHSVIDTVIQSDGGNHKVSFSGKVFFAGGYIELCLCRAFRDTLENYAFGTSLPNLYFVLDGVFSNSLLEDGVPANLAIASADWDDQDTADWFNRTVFGVGTSSHLCPSNTWDGDVPNAPYRFHIYRGNRPVADFGSGGREINVRLIMMSELESQL